MALCQMPIHHGVIPLSEMCCLQSHMAIKWLLLTLHGVMAVNKKLSLPLVELFNIGSPKKHSSPMTKSHVVSTEKILPLQRR
jgi:hypothetical protein